MTHIVKSIKDKYPKKALTLSIGEKSYEYYDALRLSGVDRFLLRHETIDNKHYSKLHPSTSSITSRKDCLYSLKKLGYQTGTGIMVGSPFQTIDNIISDIEFIKELSPQMIGIGPFLPHKDTPFKNKEKGSLELTLSLISIFRLLFPKSLIPATTSLATISNTGRIRGILSGANVVMPNLSPKIFRKSYSLYDNKVSTDEEACEGFNKLSLQLNSIGYEASLDRGDWGDL